MRSWWYVTWAYRDNLLNDAPNVMGVTPANDYTDAMIVVSRALSWTPLPDRIAIYKVYSGDPIMESLEMTNLDDVRMLKKFERMP